MKKHLPFSLYILILAHTTLMHGALDETRQNSIQRPVLALSAVSSLACAINLGLDCLYRNTGLTPQTQQVDTDKTVRAYVSATAAMAVYYHANKKDVLRNWLGGISATLFTMHTASLIKQKRSSQQSNLLRNQDAQLRKQNALIRHQELYLSQQTKQHSDTMRQFRQWSKNRIVAALTYQNRRPHKDLNPEDQCCICLESMATLQSKPLFRLSCCGQVICSTDYKTWLKTQANTPYILDICCPHCRQLPHAAPLTFNIATQAQPVRASSRSASAPPTARLSKKS